MQRADGIVASDTGGLAAVTTVFLSYARADEEAAPFTSRLHDELLAHGLDVWFDRKSMPSRSLTFLQEIRDAIRARDRLVVVLGPAAICSEYVRAEWQAALVEGKVVVPVLRGVKYADVPDELRNLQCPDGSETRPFKDVVAELVRVLGDPVPPLAPLLGAVPDQPAHFRPRPDDMTRLASALLYDVEHPVVLSGPERVHVLHGMGGSGKSVLAAAFARSSAARRVFFDGVVWIGVSVDQSSLDVLRALHGALGAPVLQQTGIPAAVSALRGALAAGRNLVVLDNIWSLEQVEPVVQAIPPVSRVLVTTRHAEIATSLGATSQPLDALSDKAALQHLADWIGTPVEKLPPEAAEVAKHCRNLPLALALQGALALEKVSWADLLNALRNADVGFAEHLLAAYPYRSVLQALDVGIVYLQRSDADAAARFCELAAFSWGGGVPEPAVVGFWQHHAGLAEPYGRRMLTKLEQRALVRIDAASSPRRVRLHDLMAAVLSARTTDRAAALRKALLDTYRRRCNGVWAEGPADGYFHEHLVEHLELARAGQEVEALLRAEDAEGRNSWFVAQSRHGSNVAYVADVRRAWARSSARAQAELDRTGQSTLVADELRYALTCASVNTIAMGLTPPLLSIVAREEGWTTSRTLAEARAIVVPERRVEALAALAAGLSGDELDTIVIDALAAVRSIRDPYWRAGALARLVPVLGLRATMPDVQRIVDGIDEPTQRAAVVAVVAHVRAGGTLSELATTPDAADSGFLDPQGLAAQLATFSPYTHEASTLRHRYVDDRQGDERASLARAVSIANPHTRSLVLASLSDELRGDAAAAARAEAMVAARSVGDRSAAAAFRSDLVGLLAKRGHQDEALRLALADEDVFGRTATLVALAPHVADGVAAAALHAAIADFGSVPEGSGRDALAGDLAAWLAAAGDFEGIRTIAAAAGDGVKRRRVLARAALGSRAAADLLWAELDSLGGNVWPEAVAESAEVLSATHCREAVARAVRSAEPADRDLVLAAVAARLTVLGAGGEAWALLPSIRDDAWRELATADLATSLAANGDARGALEIAGSVRQVAWRIRATAPALALLEPADRSRVLDELIALAEATGDLQSSGHLHCLVLPIAEGMTRDRIAAGVIAQVPQVGDGAALACDLAIALARAGLHDEAFARATQIGETYWRAEALAGIAPLLDGPGFAARIIETARNFTSTEARLAILTGLAGPMAAAPARARYEVWNEVLEMLAGSTRREIAQYRAWLRAALGDLATDDGIRGALVASGEVFRWWP